jgi:hypothetical protein
MQRRGGLGGQPRLPRSCITADEDQLAGTGVGRSPRLLQRGQLATTADQRSARCPLPPFRQRRKRPSGHVLTLTAAPNEVDAQI